MLVNSVLGKINVDQLGKTLMHEHLLIVNDTMRKVYPQWFAVEPFVEKAVRLLHKAASHGIKTLVDMTTFQLGRDIDAIKRVADKTEINIIVCTGYHWFEELCLIDKSAEFLAEVLVNDIEKGIEGTGAKAGIIKCATDHYGVTDLNRRYIEAAAIAHRATGLPIYTHSLYPYGTDQMETLLENGVRPEGIVIGHAGDVDTMEYLGKIAEAGCFVGCDRFGVDTKHPNTQPFEKRLQAVVNLKKAGYMDKIVLSQDAACFIDYWEGKSGMGNPNDSFLGIDWDSWKFQYNYLNRYAFPKLIENGFTEEELNYIMEETPKRIFSGK